MLVVYYIRGEAMTSDKDFSRTSQDSTIQARLKKKKERNLHESIDADTLAELLEKDTKEAAEYIKGAELSQALTDLDQINKHNSLEAKVVGLSAKITALEGKVAVLEKSEDKRNKIVGYICLVGTILAFAWPQVKPYFSESGKALFEKKVCQISRACPEPRITKPKARK